MKKCARCGKVKSLDKFHKRARSKDGRASWCKKCIKEYRKGYYNKSNYRRTFLKRKYGITLAEYDEMLEIQSGGCAICGKTPKEEGKHLAVDHNHETGNIRGLLCEDCNRAIGMLGEKPQRLRAATLYLEQE